MKSLNRFNADFLSILIVVKSVLDYYFLNFNVTSLYYHKRAVQLLFKTLVVEI